MSDLMLRTVTRTHVELRAFQHALLASFTAAAERMRNEDGQDLVEYGGLLIIIAAMVAALIAIGLPTDFTNYVGPAVKSIFTSAKGG